MADSVKIRITGDDKEFQSTLSGIGKKAGSIFKGMMASQIVTKGISMLTNGLRSAINTGMQFEAAMSQVAAISGATGRELELLTETAKRYGETTMFSASQAAEALNYMALAGWDAQQSVDALGGVLDLAAASGMDLGAASDAVTDYLSAFGMEAAQAGYMADLMAYAQSNANTSATQLSDAYGNCASSMHAAGQDIETTTALLMALANQGVKGSEAGTQMAAVMRDLTQKMQNGQIRIGAASIAVTDAAGNFRDLNAILADVGRATEGMGTAEASAALMETFTARSVKAVQTILNEGMAGVDAYESALREAGGTAAQQAETMMDNLQGDVKIFQSAMEGLQITASESTNGIARSLVQEATGIVEAVNQAGKAGGIGGMADALIAQVPSLLPKLTKGVQGLLSGLGKRLPGLVKGLIATIPDMLGSVGDLVPSLIESLSEAVTAAIEGIIANLPQTIASLATSIGKAFISGLKGVGNIGQSLFDTLFGIKKPTQYEGLEADGKLTYNVKTEAVVDNTTAQQNVDAAMGEFKTFLTGEGLTSAQIMTLLAFQGTEAELLELLDTEYSGISESARNAIITQFKINSDPKSAALAGELSEYGLTNEQIAGILAFQGTPEELVALLDKDYADLSAEARAAVVNSFKKYFGDQTSEEVQALIADLEQYGLTSQQIVEILAFKGTPEELAQMLDKDYADLSREARAAIVSSFKKYFGDQGSEEVQELISDLEQYGLDNDQILDILSFKGTPAQLTAMLEKNYGDLSKTTRDAIVNSFSQYFRDTKAKEDWIKELGEYGLDEAQIADILSFKGTPEQLAQMLDKNYADLSQTARTAIVNSFKKQYEHTETLEELADTLKDEGLEAADIAEILAFKGTPGQLEELLTSQYSTLSESARNAIRNAFKDNSDPTEAVEAMEKAGFEASDIVKMLNFKGTPEQLQAELERVCKEKYPNLDASARNAIMAALNNNGGIAANLTNDLEGLGIAPEDIVAILTYTAEGDEASLESLLEDKYAGIKQDVITAVTNAWNNAEEPELKSGANGASTSLMTQFFVDMFTDGLPENNAEVAAALESAKESIRQKKQELLDILSSEDATDEENTSAEDAYNNYVQLGNALEDYAGTMANAATADCAAAGQALIDLANTCDEQMERIRASREALMSMQGRLFTLGVKGTKLTDSDLLQALNYVSEQYQQEAEAAAAARDEAISAAKTAEEYDAAQAKYEAAISAAQAHRTELLSNLIKGQTKGAEGLDVAAALANTADQIRQSINDHGGTAIQSEIEQILRDAGYGDDIVGQAVEKIFGEQQYDGKVNISQLENYDFGDEINGILAEYVERNGNVDAGMVAELLRGNGYGEDIVGQVLSKLFEASDMTTDSFNLESIIGEFDFGQLGNLLMEAINQGLIEGEENGGELDINGMILRMIGDSLKGGEASDAATEVVEGAITDASAAADGASDAGDQLDNGLASGITAGRSKVIEAAKETMRQAVNAAMVEAQIESPSKVMMRVGRYFDEGLALGIDDSVSRVVRSAVALANSVVGAVNLKPQMDLSGLTASMSGAISDIADIESSRDVVLRIRDRDLARTTDRAYNDVLNGFNRRVKMGYGRG